MEELCAELKKGPTKETVAANAGMDAMDIPAEEDEEKKDESAKSWQDNVASKIEQMIELVRGPASDNVKRPVDGVPKEEERPPQRHRVS